MSADQMQLYAMRGMISGLPEKEKGEVTLLADEFRKKLADNPDIGIIAMALVMAELAADGKLA